MTTRAIIRLAQIAHEYDLAGRPREADVIEDAMMRLADGSAIKNWWDGVKQVGTGIVDDAKAAGNAIAMPFEGAVAGAKAAWDGGGLAYAPQAAGEAEQAAWDRAKNYTSQEFQHYQQAAPALAGPGGTGLPGAMVQDAAHGVGQALQGAAQGYISNAVSQQEQAKEQANMAQWLQQAVQRHRTDGHGWEIINSAVQFGQLSGENQMRLRQQFQVAAARVESR